MTILLVFTDLKKKTTSLINNNSPNVRKSSNLVSKINFHNLLSC